MSRGFKWTVPYVLSVTVTLFPFWARFGFVFMWRGFVLYCTVMDSSSRLSVNARNFFCYCFVLLFLICVCFSFVLAWCGFVLFSDSGWLELRQYMGLCCVAFNRLIRLLFFMLCLVKKGKRWKKREDFEIWTEDAVGISSLSRCFTLLL